MFCSLKVTSASVALGLLVIATFWISDGVDGLPSSISCYTCNSNNQTQTDCRGNDVAALAKYSVACPYKVQQCMTSFRRLMNTNDNSILIERITRSCSRMYEFNLPEEGLCSVHPQMPMDRSWKSCWCSRPNCNDYTNLGGSITPDIMSISMLPSNKHFGPYESAYRI